jgi:trehalose-6-phosphate synthase
MWVHDYHLLLLPKLLRDYESEYLRTNHEALDIKMVYFLHIPFPTSQVSSLHSSLAPQSLLWYFMAAISYIVFGC